MSAHRTIRLATRASRLALAQTQIVADALHAMDGIGVEIVPLSTRADRDTRPLQEVGARGMFAVELEQALREGIVDAAVHSCKDLALVDTAGLRVAAWLEREDARDAICGPATIADIPKGARISTSSARRTAALQHLDPTWTAVPIRGNVETRLRVSAERGDDGCMLAEAGLRRLGLSVPRVVLDIEQVVPEPAQGVIVVQTRIEDSEDPVWAALHHAPTQWCANLERTIARLLDGGCETPVGVHVTRESSVAHVHWFIARPGAAPVTGMHEISAALTVQEALEQLLPQLPLDAPLAEGSQR